MKNFYINKAGLFFLMITVGSAQSVEQGRGMLQSNIGMGSGGFINAGTDGLEMDGFFELILGGDSLSEKKPHPMPLLHVSRTLHVKVQEALMIGDSKNDILSANACKMDSVGVTYGYNYGESIDVHKPTLIIDDFSGLLQVL